MSKKLAAAIFALALVPGVALAQDEGGEEGGEEGGATEGGGEGEGGGGEGGGDAAPAMGGVWKKGTMGFNIGVNSSGDAGSANALYFLGPQAALDLRIGFAFGRVMEENQIGIDLGIGYRMWKTVAGAIHTYLEPFVGIEILDFSEAGDTFGLSAGAALGAEYFFTEQFSVGGNIGLSLDLPGPIGDTVVLTTFSSGLYAGLYW